MKKLIYLFSIISASLIAVTMHAMEGSYSDHEPDLNLTGDEYILAVAQMHEAHKLPYELGEIERALEEKDNDIAFGSINRLNSKKLADARSRNGQNVLHIVAPYGDAGTRKIATVMNKVAAELEKLLFEQDRNGNTPLHLAVQLGNKDFVTMLEEKTGIKLPLEVANKEGKTPLYCAAEHGRDDILKMLIEQGADVCASAQSGMTPLLASLNGMHHSTTKIFLDQESIKRCINYTDREGTNVLSLANDIHADQEIIEKLIELGAEPKGE